MEWCGIFFDVRARFFMCVQYLKFCCKDFNRFSSFIVKHELIQNVFLLFCEKIFQNFFDVMISPCVGVVHAN